MCEEFDRAGYACDTRTLEGHTKGARTSRKRAYLVAMHWDRFGIDALEARGWCADVLDLAESLRVDPLDLDRFLLSNDDAYIEAQLAKAMEIEQQLDKIEKEPDSCWQEKLMCVLTKEGICWPECVPPPEQVMDNPHDAALIL